MTSTVDTEFIPVTIEGKPISDDGSLAYLAGALDQYHDWMQRSGNFLDLCESGVTTSGSKTVADTDSTVLFASGKIADLKTYSFSDPAPPGPKRVALYNVAAQLRTAKGTATPGYNEVFSTVTSSSSFEKPELRHQQARAGQA